MQTQSEEHIEETEECGCFACYATKHLAFVDGEQVDWRGHKVVSYIDIAIVEVDGEQKAVLGFAGPECPAILTAIIALTQHVANKVIQVVPAHGKDLN